MPTCALYQTPGENTLKHSILSLLIVAPCFCGEVNQLLASPVIDQQRVRKLQNNATHSGVKVDIDFLAFLYKTLPHSCRKVGLLLVFMSNVWPLYTSTRNCLITVRTRATTCNVQCLYALETDKLFDPYSLVSLQFQASTIPVVPPMLPIVCSGVSDRLLSANARNSVSRCSICCW